MLIVLFSTIFIDVYTTSLFSFVFNGVIERIYYLHCVIFTQLTGVLLKTEFSLGMNEVLE